MSDNVELFPGEHRTYAEEHDWLTPETGRASRNVVTFSPKFLQCSVCGRRTHRASACPSRLRSPKPID